MAQKCYILDVTRIGQKIHGAEFKEVEGDAVDLGFDVKGFVSNGNPLGETPAFWRSENWKVFHLETGARMTDYCKSRHWAVALAKDRLAANIDSYQGDVAWFLEKFGKAPAVE